MALRWQNNPRTTDRVPNSYAGNRLYKGTYARNDYQGRTSRRMHDGMSISMNYGLDTTSDDVNSSPYSSPYYINGRYNSDNIYTQSGNSSSVQGTAFLTSKYDDYADFTEDDIQGSIELWQGKQIKFEIPYSGKVVGNTITLRNTERCTGILSIYISAKDGGDPIYETSVDLCQVSEDVFEHKILRSNKVIPRNTNPRGKLYVRMEIWNEIDQKRSENPFNTGRKIEIASAGLSGHYAAEVKLGNKNEPLEEKYEYKRLPNRPLIGLIYNSYESVPVNRIEASAPGGAFVSLNGYRYDVYCIKNGIQAEVLIYDHNMNKLIDNTIAVDGRVEKLNLVQAKDYVYYVDGYSPLQKFKVGTWASQALPLPSDGNVTVNVNLATWQSSPLGSTSGVYTFTKSGNSWKYAGNTVNLATYGITITGTATDNSRITVDYTTAGASGEADISATYYDTNPVVAPSMITMHNNRIYITGFRYDPNLVQFTEIVAEGPDFDSYPYRFYAPDESPLATSYNPITAIIEYSSDTLMILGRTFYSLYRTDSGTKGTAETAYPTQVSTYTDGGGVQAEGDVYAYHGVIYSFDQDEGIRRFSGSTWSKIPSSIDSYYERVDMTKLRKIWGYANKLYMNYTDKVDGKYKCIIWDMDMNYQQYPWFQDADIPFCDVRYDDDYDIVGIHPDYPCIMKLYMTDTWRRLDSPIVFERHTKYIALPGNASDMILKRVHNKVLANANRWWWVGLSYDMHTLEQHRGKITTYRIPCWDTLTDVPPVEDAFTEQDIYEENSLSLLTVPNIKTRAISAQVRIKCKTFRAQACLVSTLLEAAPRIYS